VVLGALLHFLPDDTEVAAILKALREQMVPGSWLTMCHMTNEGAPEVAAKMVQLYESFSSPLRFRSSEAIRALFEGFDLVEPEIVPTPLWRPEGTDDVLLEQPELTLALVGVGRRRA
jgi:hypothetical protein